MCVQVKSSACSEEIGAIYDAKPDTFIKRV